MRSVNASGGRAPEVVSVSAGIPRATNGPWPYSVNGNPRSISCATTLGRPGEPPGLLVDSARSRLDEARCRRAGRVACDLDSRLTASADRIEVDCRDDVERRMRCEPQRAQPAERAGVRGEEHDRVPRAARACRRRREGVAACELDESGRAGRVVVRRRSRRPRRRDAPSRRSPGGTARGRPPTGSEAASGRAPGSSPTTCPTRPAGRTAASGRGTRRRRGASSHRRASGRGSGRRGTSRASALRRRRSWAAAPVAGARRAARSRTRRGGRQARRRRTSRGRGGC